MTFRALIKTGIAYLLFFTGFLSVLASIRLRKRAVVLMYHRVLRDREYARSFSSGGMVVFDSTFSKHMRYLRKHFRVITLDDLIHHMQNSEPFKNKSCMVTFDDGWKDNFRNAFPILKENNFSALIFLTVGFIGSHRRFWQDRLAESLLKLRRRSVPSRDALMERIKGRDGGIERIMQCREEVLKDEISAFVASQKKKSVDEIEELIALLSNGEAGSEDVVGDEEVFLDWKDIELMGQDGVEFGSHGLNHLILPQCEKEMVEREARVSRLMIEEKLGKEIIAFSYPNGELSDEIANLVFRSGYRVAFGTENGSVSAKDDPYRLKRINIHQDMTSSIPMFLARVVGLW